MRDSVSTIVRAERRAAEDSCGRNAGAVDDRLDFRLAAERLDAPRECGSSNVMKFRITFVSATRPPAYRAEQRRPRPARQMAAIAEGLTGNFSTEGMLRSLDCFTATSSCISGVCRNE